MQFSVTTITKADKIVLCIISAITSNFFVVNVQTVPVESASLATIPIAFENLLA